MKYEIRKSITLPGKWILWLPDGFETYDAHWLAVIAMDKDAHRRHLKKIADNLLEVYVRDRSI